MKEKILTIFLVGLFFTAGIITIPAKFIENEAQDEHLDIEIAQLYNENNVFIGETWTVYNPEAFSGSSNADAVNMNVEWVVNPGDDEAHGTLGMNIFDFNFAGDTNYPLPLPLVTTTVCDYEFTVYDGPDSSDGELTSGHNSFMGGGLKYQEMAHPFDVKTENQDRRTLGFQLNAKTQTYIPAFRLTVENELGSISKLGQMIIDFISPAEKEKQIHKESLSTSPDDHLDIDLGRIDVYTSDNEDNIPECDIFPNFYEDPFRINESAVINIDAHLDYDISLVEKVHPPILSFLPCLLIIKINAFSTNINQQYRQRAEEHEYTRTLLTETYSDSGTWYLPTITLDTSEFPTGASFLINYNLIVPNLFGKLLDANSAKINIRWEPI